MIRRALLSVSDKTGLVDLAKALAARGVELLSTGGTLRALAEAGLTVRGVDDYTGSPEVMDGRVKTLHPRVHGGILMRGAVDEADLARLGGASIDLVVVNLYPFEATLKKPGAAHDELVENIDIGGPAMLRSAAKNHARVTVLTDPADYAAVLAELEAHGDTTSATRARLAAKVFAHTARYDGMIAAYLSSVEAGSKEAFPRYLTLPFERAYGLRYGENPHQAGAFYREVGAPAGSLARAEALGKGEKELSFNNLTDVEAALACVRDLAGHAAVVVKHANPCGVATGASLADAYLAAREADALSAFGGVVALSHEVDVDTAKRLVETFLECVVAPSFTAEALEILHDKPKLRLLATGRELEVPVTLGGHLHDPRGLVMKRVSGGLVVATDDVLRAPEVREARVVTKRSPTSEELGALDLAWRVCKHVKSNAIVLARGRATVGVGAGQMSRVESVRIACRKAGELTTGSALASDAFFPFPDGVELAAEHGVTAIAQPGGSVKDADVIAAADRAGLAMVFTGVRHFRH